MTKEIKKVIAVTGANGFIGKHVISELEKHNIKIIPLTRDNFDIKSNNTPSFKEIGSPDCLIHLAWSNLNNLNDLSHFEIDLPAHYNFLKKLIDTGLKSLVVTGTCAEYWMKSGKLSEDMEVSPSNTYGFAKDSLRRQLQFLQKDKKFNLSWARLFYMYGSGQSEKSIISLLENSVKKGEEFFKMSGGKQVRDYLPVEVVAEYLVKLSIESNNDGIFNICSGEPITIEELIKNHINKHNLDIKLELGYYPYSNYEPMEFYGTNKKIKDLFK